MTTSVRPLPAAGDYRIDPGRSTVSFKTKHMFGLGAVTGSFGPVEGDLVIAAGGSSSMVRAVVSADGFDTGSKQRDKQVMSKAFLDPGNHPVISFASTAATQRAEGWVVRGELTARGTAAPVEFIVTDYEVDDQAVTVQAKARVDRYAHGITKMKGMAARFLDIEVRVVARRV
jgi:polyisoprenoid-binding protein YceI